MLPQSMSVSLDQTSQTPKSSLQSAKGQLSSVEKDPEIAASARDFEAAFITQMLKYSGLGEALTKSGGEAVSAFSDFYLENVAESLADKGGFGLAETFYNKLLQKSEEPMTRDLSGDKV